MGRDSAFTLIEAVLVMAILVALAAITFPVFARAREGARRTTCKSNLHQIGIAIQLYRDDYDGIDPEKGVPLSHSQMGLPYHFALDELYTRYVKNRGVLFCPSAILDRADYASTYWWAVMDSEYTDPSQDYERIAALRGPNYPLVICGSHNGPFRPREALRSSEVLIYHVLRIDGRVEVKKTTAESERGGLSWW
jgi:type II secretory pathway pseudopilin PulG